MFYVDVNIEKVKLGKNQRAIIHKSLKQSCVSNQYYGDIDINHCY